MKRRDVCSGEMGTTKGVGRLRPGRANLRVVAEAEEWPDDLLPALLAARDAYVEQPAPEPSDELVAFFEGPAHGRFEGEGLLGPEEAEALTLLPLAGRRRWRRHLVGLGGAAAALALVALALRPALSPSDTSTVPSVTSGAPTPPTSEVAPPEPVVTIAADEATPALPPVDPATTVAAASTLPAPSTPASSTSPKTTTKGKSAPAPPAPTSPPAPAPAAAPTVQEQVLAYYDQANTRGKCVAKQPDTAGRAALIVACGPEPVPPANLVQYWAAKDGWQSCATPLQKKGWSTKRVEGQCGPAPDRADYDVPLNPYSRST